MSHARSNTNAPSTRPAGSRGARSRTSSPASTGRLIAASALLAATPVLGVAAPALAHDQLEGTTVITDQADGSVDALRLTFSDSVLELGTEITVTGPDGADATDGAPQIDGPDVTQPLVDDLIPGDYLGAWRVVSSDGHPIDGGFSLTIPQDPAQEPVIEPRDLENTDGDLDDAATAQPDSQPEEEGHDHESDADAGRAPVGAVIAVVVGGAAVIAGGIAAVTVGQRRRARGMAADAQGAAGRTGADEGGSEEPGSEAGR
ncbi:MAG: copper resistance protein CopC [Leucobacter sp.]